MPKIKNSRTFYMLHDMKTTSKEEGSWDHIIGYGGECLIFYLGRATQYDVKTNSLTLI